MPLQLFFLRPLVFAASRQNSSFSFQLKLDTAMDTVFANAVFFYFARYSFIAAAAFLPSPIAKITVAAPRTISPPAQTFVLLVACFSSTVI